MGTPKTWNKAFGEEITAMLKSGEEVNLPGVGKLSVVDKPARTGRNPATGEPVQIAAKRVPKFAISGKLKEAVAG